LYLTAGIFTQPYTPYTVTHHSGIPYDMTVRYVGTELSYLVQHYEVQFDVYEAASTEWLGRCAVYHHAIEGPLYTLSWAYVYPPPLLQYQRCATASPLAPWEYLATFQRLSPLFHKLHANCATSLFLTLQQCFPEASQTVLSSMVDWDSISKEIPTISRHDSTVHEYMTIFSQWEIVGSPLQRNLRHASRLCLGLPTEGYTLTRHGSLPKDLPTPLDVCTIHIVLVWYSRRMCIQKEVQEDPRTIIVLCVDEEIIWELAVLQWFSVVKESHKNFSGCTLFHYDKSQWNILKK
jgi:hypothetical protein